MQLLDKLYSKKYLLPLLGTVLALYIFSLWGRIPDIDDAWLGEYAYWLEKFGYVRSELFRGLTGQETLFVVHHKLLTLHGALFIKFFGFSLYSLKSVSLVYLLVFIRLFYSYTCKWKNIFNLEDFLFSLIILFTFTQAFKYSFLFRPEIMVMCIGFAGFILLEKYLEKEDSKYWLIFSSGLIFGLTVFTHLNSLVFIASTGVLLLWNKKYTGFIVFGIGAILTSSFYFYDFRGIDSFYLWSNQFFKSTAIDSLKDTPFWLKPIVNLLVEHMRYFHNIEIIVFSVFMMITVITGFRILYKKQANLVRFAILMALFTGIITMHKSRQYILPFFPYLLIIITITFKEIKENQIIGFSIFKNIEPKMFRGIMIFLFLVFFFVSTFFNVDLALKKFTPADNQALTLKYAGSDISKMNIVAPETFIFNEIEIYNRIQSDLFYTEMAKSDPSFSGEEFFQKASGYDISLIMVTTYRANLLGIENSQIGEKHGDYQVVDKNDEMIVFKRYSNSSESEVRN